MHSSLTPICFISLKKGKNFIHFFSLILLRISSEIASGKESILKKLMRKDCRDSPINQHLILLVCNIEYDESGRQYIIELSDGWYSIFAIIKKENLASVNNFNSTNNELLCELVQKNKLFPGQKLHFAFLENYPFLNCLKNYHYPYLIPEKTEKRAVMICYNGFSRAKWHEKLGDCKKSLIKCLSSLRPGGKKIPLIDVFVVKKFPILSIKGKNIKFSFLAADALKYYTKGGNNSYIESQVKNQNCAEIYDSLLEGCRVQIRNLYPSKDANGRYS